MAIISRAAAKLAVCSGETNNSILNILTAFGLPTNTDLKAETLYQFALSDKKRMGEFVNLIIPERIGYCRIQKTPMTQLISFIEAGL